MALWGWRKCPKTGWFPATNLLEVVVTFNQDVEDVDAVAEKANYTVDLETIASVDVTGAVATLTLDDYVTNQDEAKLTIKDEILAAETETTFTFFDNTLPEVVGTTVTGPKSFEIEFTEPVTAGTVTVKSGNSSLSVNAGGITGEKTTKLTIPMYSSFVDGTDYTVEISDFEDGAPYKNVKTALTLAYVKDVTPPTVSLVEASQERVVVEFDKPVMGLTAEQFSHTFTAWTALKITDADDFDDTELTTSDSVTKVYVWFNGDDSANERPLAEGTTTVKVLAKDDSDNEIVDEWENKFATTSLSATVTADLTAAEVVELKATEEDTLYIQFSKDVTFDEDNVEVLNADGTTNSDISISVSASAEDDFDYDIDLGTSLAGKSILVNIKDVEDTTLNTNKTATYSMTIDIDDLTAPTISEVSLDAANNLLYVFFNEELSDTALVATNYYIVDNTNAYTKLSETATFFTNSKIVKIELTDAQKAKLAGGDDKVFVTGVEDVAGNEIEANLSGNYVALSTLVPAMDTVEATSRTEVVITYDTELGSVDQDAFAIAGGAVIAGMSVSLDDDGMTVVTLTITDATKLAANTSGVAVTYADETLVEDLFGTNPADDESVNIVDKIAPEVTAIAQTDVDEITVTFTEEVNTASAALAATDLVITVDGDVLVAGTEYDVALAGDTTVVITLDAPVTDDYTVESVASPKYIFDGEDTTKGADENFIAVIADEDDVAFDATAPVLTAVSHTATAATTANLLFTPDEAGTYYYLVYAAADGAPTAAEVVAQGAAVTKGTAATTAAAQTVAVTGLTTATAYKAYVVVVDAAGNISTVGATASVTQP